MGVAPLLDPYCESRGHVVCRVLVPGMKILKESLVKSKNNNNNKTLLWTWQGQGDVFY